MQPLLLSMQVVAEKRDEGLRPELIGLLEEAGACCNSRTGSDGPVTALQVATETAPAASQDILYVEIVGPQTLLPYGRKCSLRFDASGAVTVTIGMRDYGRGYTSPYFAGLIVARLGVPVTRVHLYYAGNLPAVKIDFRDLRAIPNRESVGPENAQIGDLIEQLCEAAIDMGCRYPKGSRSITWV